MLFAWYENPWLAFDLPHVTFFLALYVALNVIRALIVAMFFPLLRNLPPNSNPNRTNPAPYHPCMVNLAPSLTLTAPLGTMNGYSGCTNLGVID